MFKYYLDKLQIQRLNCSIVLVTSKNKESIADILNLLVFHFAFSTIHSDWCCIFICFHAT
jgi:hypothetical protein